MNLLLDTCTFLWMIWDELPANSPMRDPLGDAENLLYLSPVSIWEATVKHMRGKLEVRAKEPAWLHFVKQRKAHGIIALPFDESAIAHLENLPVLHKDPFDRLLICQAIEHGLVLVTPDGHIRQYPIKTLWD